MKFVPISEEDFPTWTKFRKELYGTIDDEYNDAEMRSVIARNDWWCYLLKSDDDAILGFVELSSRNIVDGCLTSPVAYVEGLFVSEPFRNKGVGRDAMSMIVEWCRKRGFSELALDTEIHNTAAQRFYEAVGFTESDRVVEYRRTLNKGD